MVEFTSLKSNNFFFRLFFKYNFFQLFQSYYLNKKSECTKYTDKTLSKNISAYFISTFFKEVETHVSDIFMLAIGIVYFVIT